MSLVFLRVVCAENIAGLAASRGTDEVTRAVLDTVVEFISPGDWWCGVLVVRW